MNDPCSLAARPTSRVFDITGPENTIIFLAAPGDEAVACGGLIAEACARGRPPFVVLLGDGAPDGDAARARACENASRLACRRLGLPDDRLLFVGLRQNDFPALGTPLFEALGAAMNEVSWRRDCNVVLAPFAAPERQDAADAVATWHLAGALAGGIAAPLVAGFQEDAPAWFRASVVWRLNMRQWDDRKAAAARAHGRHIRPSGHEIYGRTA
jgi:LmbE family N-acetylglucosaminyl deacetylase